MVINSCCIFVLWTKVVSALEALRSDFSGCNEHFKDYLYIMYVLPSHFIQVIFKISSHHQFLVNITVAGFTYNQTISVNGRVTRVVLRPIELPRTPSGEVLRVDE